ncbi:hypothetical protein [Candidatus Nitrosocosmicus hydrocola]|uniref:hypothetical protein n=1 Tax=Candidatus Nitrosocosmicus hydrocola TaxID=1826872 RepID=UPI0011E5FC4D|nr:hypothetical protein [Candidatus Nitrosocosmicus hydrocola]
MRTDLRRYVDPQLGIAFEYPPEWVLVENCKIRFGVDVLFSNKSSNFGIIKISEQLRENCAILNYKNLDMYAQLTLILKSSIQKNEMIVEDIRFNKYKIKDSNSVTVLLTRWDKRAGANMVIERTLLVHNSNYKTEYFTVAFEILSEDYASLSCQNQIRKIVESFRLI